MPEHPLVAELLDSERRDAAFCALLKERRYRHPPGYEEESDCRVTHVVTSAVPGGGRMYVVFHNADPDIYPYAGPGTAGGPFTLVDGEGFLVPPYSNANVMGSDDRVLQLTSDGQLALAQTWGYGHNHAWTVQVLHITPVAPSQSPALSVILGPASLGQDRGKADVPSWTWQATDASEQSPFRVLIGQRDAHSGIEEVAASFTYDAPSGRFVGPSGGGSASFVVVNDPSIGGIFSDAEAWAARSIVLVRELTEDLPVDHRHNVVEGALLELVEVRWPLPSDTQRRLVLRSKSACAIERLQVRQEEGWTGITSPDGPQLRLSLEVLRTKGASQRMFLELSDACGGQLIATFPAAP